MRDELIEAVVAALDGRWPVSRDEERQASAIALDAILGRLTAFIGDRALAYDKQADAEKDGTLKMQGATLAVLANDLVALSTLARHDRV